MPSTLAGIQPEGTTESAAVAGCVIGRIGGAMPRIYDNPKEMREQRGENHKRPTVGNGPAGPSAQTDNRVNFALIVIALAILLVMVLFNLARG